MNFTFSIASRLKREINNAKQSILDIAPEACIWEEVSAYLFSNKH